MSSLREALFTVFLNASWQIALFALVARSMSGLIQKARAKYQHLFYLSVLVLCLALPVFNSFSSARSSGLVGAISHKAYEGESQDANLWLWRANDPRPDRRVLGPAIECAVAGLWIAMILYQLVHFGRGLRRVRTLRRAASPLPLEQIALSRRVLSSERVEFFASSDVSHPVTIGVLRPAVIIPATLVPVLDAQGFVAIVAHEYAHIRRADFVIHIACEILTLPFALHPGIRYIMSKISQTRELACDEYAAAQLGERRTYARALLRLASLCLETSSRSAVGLGMFHADNLEDRIMKLTHKNKSLSRAATLGLVLAIGVTFSTSAAFASVMSRVTGQDTQRFAGTWNWIFHGKSFATMRLVATGTGLKGTVTESRIALNDDGTLKKADPSDDTAPKQIVKAQQDGEMLRVTVEDGFEFVVSLKDTTHGEILPGGAPPNMKPIPLQKAQ